MRNFLTAIFILTSIFIFSIASYGAVIQSITVEDITEPDEPFKITKIDFYPSGAKFTFEVYPNSDGEINTELPGAFLEDKTIITSGNGAGVQIFTKTRAEWTPEFLEELKSKLDDQIKTVEDLEARKNSLEQTIKILNDYDPEKADPKNMLEYIPAAQKLRYRTESDLRDLQEDLKNEREILEALESEYNPKKPGRAKYSLVVTGKAEDTVTLETFTTFAGWTPKYFMYLNSETGEIENHMYTEIFQKTGLNYEGEIILHTKDPYGKITTPDLRPVRVFIKPKNVPPAASRRREEVERSERNSSRALYRKSAMDSGIDEYAVEESSVRSAPTVSQSLSDWVIEAEANITGDGNKLNLEIELYEASNFKSEAKILLIPELRRDAWIIAELDPASKRLIPAMTELFIDGRPAGKINLTESKQAQHKIEFGYIDQITIKKEPIIEKTGTSWFSGVLTSGYKLIINNGTDSTRKIIVKDRLPIPTDEKIKLEIKKITPAQKELSAQKILTWELEIPAGKSSEIIVDFALTYPQGEELGYR